MSTIFGVLVLAFINSYMVLVFFKTIFLVLVIGIFHALILLPIVLYETAPYTDRFNRISYSETSSTNLSVESLNTTSTKITISNFDKTSKVSSDNSIKSLKISIQPSSIKSDKSYNKKLKNHLIKTSEDENYKNKCLSKNICKNSSSENLFKSIIFLGIPPPILPLDTTESSIIKNYNYLQQSDDLTINCCSNIQHQQFKSLRSDNSDKTTKFFVNDEINPIYIIKNKI